MEELLIEEKAKRYDEAIKKVNDYYEGKTKLYSDVDKTLDYLFPELKESEDEKIRKWIKKELESKYVVDNIVNNVIADKALAWLEKQRKENPLKGTLCDVFDDLKFGLDPCPKQGEQKPWSEEDKVILDEIIDFFENGTVKLQHDLSLYASWLKSLKDRYTWKPSEEQIAALACAISYVRNKHTKTVVNSLYDDLKALG